MQDGQRYTMKDFPPYCFLPGKGPHPAKSGGYREGVAEPELKKIEDWSSDQAYLYSLDLYNHGYYWESHVWWEAFWNTYGRSSGEALFFQGLIKMAAGKIKQQLGQIGSSKGHFSRACELIESSQKLCGFPDQIFGISFQEVFNQLEYLQEEPERKSRLVVKLSP